MITQNICLIWALYVTSLESFPDHLKNQARSMYSLFGRPTSKEESTPPPPSRVTNKINIPIKQQIAWARAYKRLLLGTDAVKGIGKKFRQKKGSKESATEEEIDSTDYSQVKPPAVFVDGYNIIGYLNSQQGSVLNFEEARDCLVSDLCVLRGATGWWIEVVFDAYKTGASFSTREATDNVFVTFTSSSETADNYIERKFEELRKQGFTNIVVATDDNLLRMNAGSSGAGYISASMLTEEFRIAYRGWDNLAVDLEKSSTRKQPKLRDHLSEDLKRAIESLRNGDDC